MMITVHKELKTKSESESNVLASVPQNNEVYFNIQKGNLDLMVLRYMARRLNLTLCQIDQSAPLDSPLLFTLPERHSRTHRIAIYKYSALVLKHSFAFVGFISRTQKNLQPSIVHEIQAADKKLVKELVNNPGIVSYSSLQMRNGDWCNLVLLMNTDAKSHLQSTKTHQYAAFHLAPHYYDWIRLHNGLMPHGLDHTEMLLQKTKHYSFPTAQQKPAIQEQTYGTSLL